VKKETKEKIETIGTILATVLVVLLIVMIIYWIYLSTLPKPPKTLYLTSNLFPLKTYYYSYGNVIISEYILYGIPQPNGTECANKIAVYTFNYTTQSLSPMPEIITDPKEVKEEYNTWIGYGGIETETGNYIVIPGINTTLLCPSIINNRN